MRSGKRKKAGADAEDARRLAMRRELEGILAALDSRKAFRAFKKEARATDLPVELGRREFPVMYLAGRFGLIEAKPTGSKVMGFSGGLGVPVGLTSVSIGGIRGRIEPGEVELQISDPRRVFGSLLSGDVLITNRRTVYLGKTRTAEWRYSQVIRVDDYGPHGTQRQDVSGISAATLFHVAHQTYLTGMAYPSAIAEPIRLRLDFALSLHRRKQRSFEVSLHQRLEDLETM